MPDDTQEAISPAAREYANYWEEKKKREAEEDEARRAALRGIPLRRYLDVVAVPWQGGLLYGPAGVGKTRQAISRLMSEHRGMFFEATDFIEESRLIEFDRASEFQEKRHDLAFTTAHLVLDDLGARRPTQFAEDTILRLVNDRWKAERETLVTSNLAPEQIAELWGERIASRIFGFGPAILLEGPDRRIE